ncbi:hypothetical protein BX666DRAFT_1946753 [Dichotomocladium elegans]|nr:hypothetical protein BX666DRAFT_1946753 [Dichotomocladium elegans]
MATMALKRRTPSLNTLPTVPNISVIDNPLPTASITNKPAALGASLYHICRSVLDKLTAVEGMNEYLDDAGQSPHPLSAQSPSTSEPTTPTSSDPLSKLWSLCRRGAPLCTLFNALNPAKPLKVDPNLNLKQNACKASVYHFIVACRDQLHFSEDELFTITDLYQDDTNGFVKVVNTVEKLIHLLEKDGVIAIRSSNRNSDPSAPKDTRDQVVLEILNSERKYVQDLEVLQNYMRDLQNQKIVSPDTIHYLFGNLNTLLDFQRRFLIQLENTAENPPEEQRFCQLFLQMEDAFSVYEPYCANYYSAQDLVIQEAPKLEKLAHILNPTYELSSMLIKPIQRICKYPLLIGNLVKATNKDWPHYSEMLEGLEAIKRIADKVNETQRKHENLMALEELKRRVDENERDMVDSHGTILLQDKLVMHSGDQDRELQIYLFDKTLLICKVTDGASTMNINKANKLIIRKRRASIQTKGRILTNRIISITNKSVPGIWALSIEFRAREVERFMLKFRNEEHLRLWETTLNKVKTTHKTHVPNTHLLSMTTPPTPHGRSNGLYFDDDDEGDDEEDYFQSGRSRSNSTSAQQAAVAAAGGSNGSIRPRMGRQNSQDASMFITTARPPLPPPMPSMSLSSISRNITTSSSDYGVFPASPPPSSPSSPGSASRTSSGALSSPWYHRGDDSTLVDIGAKFLNATDALTPASEEFRPLGIPPARSQSHSAVPGSSMHSGGPSSLPPMAAAAAPTTRSHTRNRSQSSPNIHRNGTPSQWDDVPHVPINSRTLYRDNNSTMGTAVRNVASIPHLSETANSQQHLQSHPSPTSADSVKIKLNYNDGIYVIMVPEDVTFTELIEKADKKIRLVGNLKMNDVLGLKYQDEDGDLITIDSDDDVQMAFENRVGSALNLFVHI